MAVRNTIDNRGVAMATIGAELRKSWARMRRWRIYAKENAV